MDASLSLASESSDDRAAARAARRLALRARRLSARCSSLSGGLVERREEGRVTVSSAREEAVKVSDGAELEGYELDGGMELSPPKLRLERLLLLGMVLYGVLDMSVEVSDPRLDAADEGARWR